MIELLGNQFKRRIVIEEAKVGANQTDVMLLIRIAKL